MILCPIEEKDSLDKISKKHPWSRLRLEQVSYQGRRYFSVFSSDIDLLVEIQQTFPINKDPTLQDL